jgi:hypothetical protein
MIRRDNLRSSVAELEKRLDRAREEALEAFEQLKLTETAGDLEAQRQVRPGSRRKPSRPLGGPMSGREPLRSGS